MILVDTSVWIDHFRKGNSQLEKLLYDGDVVCHSMIVGELACGNIKNRNEILELLQSLPLVQQVEHDDIIQFIENKKLMGKGLGYIDMHLLVSAILADALFWTLDKRLGEISRKLRVGVSY
ncbi:MAG: type II toxin-antitoxin system VapC family toxin [Candidatus Anammoxibacter sp.]